MHGWRNWRNLEHFQMSGGSVVGACWLARSWGNSRKQETGSSESKPAAPHTIAKTVEIHVETFAGRTPPRSGSVPHSFRLCSGEESPSQALVGLLSTKYL